MSFESLGMRHLEDENMLLSHGHDAPLKKGQEDTIFSTVNSIIGKCLENGTSRIDIIASGQKRTTQTSEMVARSISGVSSEKLDVSVQIDKRLMDLRQPQPRLPEGYKDGEVFPPLKRAWEIFWDETFKNQNFTYKFGDTLDGKYPELADCFEGEGESYAQFCSRFYDFLYDFSEKYSDRVDTLPLIIGHNATYALLHEFSQISKDMAKQQIIKPIEMGELPNITWEYFQNMKDGQLSRNPEHGELTSYDLSGLVNPEIREVIAIERDVLLAKITQNQDHNVKI